MQEQCIQNSAILTHTNCGYGYFFNHFFIWDPFEDQRGVLFSKTTALFIDTMLYLNISKIPMSDPF